MEDSETLFNRALHSVGDDGKFQRRYNVVFNFFLACFVTMAYMNHILAMTVPDHWCRVPGREEKNISIELWKNMTLPRELNSQGLEVFSSCRMHNIPNGENVTTLETDSKHEITACQYGYEYDKTWFTKTAPSSQNWVCDKELYASNVFAAAKLGEVCAGIVFGYLGDMIGRRYVFFIALTVTCFGRFVTPFVVQWYPALIVASIISTLPSMTASQAIMVTIMEMSPSKDRAFIAQLQNIGWTMGLCMLSLINWLVGDWTTFMIITTSPLLLYFPLTMYLIESPRWLLSRGKVIECIKQLKIIAKVNGTRLSSEYALLLKNALIKPEKVYGVRSLFSNFRLAKNTILMVIGWMCCTLSYYTLVLNILRISGNPFLNFSFLAMAELPSFLVARFLSDRFGRRFTGGFGFLLGICGFVPIIFTMNCPNITMLHIGMNFLSKFSVSIAYFATVLQGLEIYPTNVRQSGNSLGFMAGNVFSILGPYIVHVGKKYDARFPYVIITILGLLGAIVEIFLPETLHERLPETIHEARTFGIDQPFWSFPRKKKDLCVSANMKFIKHQIKENNDSDH